ncbi:MAG: trigger factor, partial [Acetobacter orientalis]
MQVTETLSEGLKRGFTITIPAADLDAKQEARLKEVAAGLKLPGFRPGKVPVSIARQRYADAVRAEVLEQAVSEALSSTLDERGLRPAGQPKVDLVSGQEQGKDLEFKVETEILPEITVPDLSDLSLTRLKAVAGDEAIDKVVADIAKRQRNFEVVEEVRPSVKGDVLTIDFVGKRDGVAFDGGTAEDVNVELGGEGFIPGFAEQIEGMQPGEEKVITVTFPENYGAEELAGKEATFDIKVKALKKAVDAPIDDELAKKLGFETLEQLRDLVRKQVEG